MRGKANSCVFGTAWCRKAMTFHSCLAIPWISFSSRECEESLLLRAQNNWSFCNMLKNEALYSYNVYCLNLAILFLGALFPCNPNWLWKLDTEANSHWLHWVVSRALGSLIYPVFNSASPEEVLLTLFWCASSTKWRAHAVPKSLDRLHRKDWKLLLSVSQRRSWCGKAGERVAFDA